MFWNSCNIFNLDTIYEIIKTFSGFTICSTIVPDINPTPPLEFPSDGLHVRIVQATTEASDVEITPYLNIGNNDKTTTNSPANLIQEESKRKFTDRLFKLSQPINVIAKINENFTENYIENKYYSNHIEENWSSIILTSIVLMVMAVIVLSCSALCLRKVQK